MVEEYNALIKNETWSLVGKPVGVNVLRESEFFGINLTVMAHWHGTRLGGSYVASPSVRASIMRRPSAPWSKRLPFE